MINKCLTEVSDLFNRHADPGKGQEMSRYMRNLFPFLGISSPERKELSKDLFARKYMPEGNELEQFIEKLWEIDEREFQYFGMNYLQRKWKSCHQAPIDLLEFTLTNKSWWDTVDFLATNIAGPIFLKHEDLLRSCPEKWIRSDNIWLQRSALIFQLKYKEKTDQDTLFEFIRRTAHSKEFFIRKAIGWALRQYSKTNAGAVIKFTSTQSLSPLSKKEALKWLETKK